MPIVISPITSPTDIPTIVSIISTTFAHTAPLVDAIYPHHDTPHGSAAAIASLTHEFNTNSSARFLKAVDTETGEVVGQANWLVVNGREGEREEKEGERGLGEGPWDSPEEREFAELLYGSLLAQRNEFMGRMGGRGLVLTFLSVLPAHQRRGAGSQLIKWGTDLADSMGLDVSPCLFHPIFPVSLPLFPFPPLPFPPTLLYPPPPSSTLLSPSLLPFPPPFPPSNPPQPITPIIPHHNHLKPPTHIPPPPPF
ncbi:MAG: hypothetical protein L6R42_009231 [Xanthoria sp. 1 TBL-2021]|nr:MAG: hypothetical protein L6R42_009231 [Xanthoria sp. 1 TBL-2021]